MQKLVILWRSNKLLVSAFVLSVVVMLFFAVRFTLFAIYWNDPAHRNQALEPWMTLGYVAHSWRVPRDQLIDRLDLQQGGGPRPLEEIAKEKGIPYDAFAGEVDATVQQLLEERPAE